MDEDRKAANGNVDQDHVFGDLPAKAFEDRIAQPDDQPQKQSQQDLELGEDEKPFYPNIFSTINSNDKMKLIQLETTTAKEVAVVRWLTTMSVLWALVVMPVGTALARTSWAPAGCTATQCDVTSFKVMAWFNLISISIMIGFNVIFFFVYGWTVVFKLDKVRPETWWGLCLSPVVIVANNPLLYLDRVPHLINISGDLATAMVVLRSVSNAFATFGFTLYVVAKFGSLSRDENVDEPYPWKFYLIRGGLGFVLFALMVGLSLHYRTELSAQPLVSLITLARREGISPGVYIAAVTVGVTQSMVFGFFFVAYYHTGRRIREKSYMDTRLKHLNLQFFWSHTFVPLGCTIVTAAICSLLYPGDLANFRSPSAAGFLTENFVLDVPYYLRSGIVFVYSMYAAVEGYFALPAQYKPTWIESQLREKIEKIGKAQMKSSQVKTSRFGASGLDIRSQANMPATAADESKQVSRAFPLEWVYRQREDGTLYKEPTKLVFEELIFMFNLSWLVYCSDEVIEACMMDQIDLGSPYRLRNIWRESMRDLVLIVLESPHHVVVVFRGTVSPKNWKINFMMSQELHPPAIDPEWLQGKWKRPAFGGREPKVHEGFWRAYESIRVELLRDLEECFKEVPTRKRLLCAGHSLGGALATLIAFDARLELGLGEEAVSLITFGSPKVGNRAFARRFNAVILDNFRIVNHSDAITNVPKTLVHFEHVPRGVLVDLHGNMIIDPLYVDVKFFHGNSLLPHMMSSYRDALSAVIIQSGNSDFQPDFWDFSLYECLENPDAEAVANLGNTNAVLAIGSGRQDMGQSFTKSVPVSEVGDSSTTIGIDEGQQQADVDSSQLPAQKTSSVQDNASVVGTKLPAFAKRMASMRPMAGASNLDQNPFTAPPPVGRGSASGAAGGLGVASGAGGGEGGGAFKKQMSMLPNSSNAFGSNIPGSSHSAVGGQGGNDATKKRNLQRFSSIRRPLASLNLDQNPLAHSGGGPAGNAALGNGAAFSSIAKSTLTLSADNLDADVEPGQETWNTGMTSQRSANYRRGGPPLSEKLQFGRQPSSLKMSFTSASNQTPGRAASGVLLGRTGDSQNEAQMVRQMSSQLPARTYTINKSRSMEPGANRPGEMRAAFSSASLANTSGVLSPQTSMQSSVVVGDGQISRSGTLIKYVPKSHNSATFNEIAMQLDSLEMEKIITSVESNPAAGSSPPTDRQERGMQ